MQTSTQLSGEPGLARPVALNVPLNFEASSGADCEIVEFSNDDGWAQWTSAASAQGMEIPVLTASASDAQHSDAILLQSIHLADPFANVGKNSA